MKTKTHEIYTHQVKLLLQILPLVLQEKCFCLKGGTAINLFLQDMPRFSVDIDLVYTPINNRSEAFLEIESSLLNIKNSIEKSFPKLRFGENRTKSENQLSKLFVKSDDAQIIIEPNLILRGTLLPTESHELCPKAENEFEMSVIDIQTLSKEEIYAGKICAALDRQHPRDLFDIYMLYKSGGIDAGVRQAFVAYLACSPRPIHELLSPNRLDIANVFSNEFQGMTSTTISLNDLVEIREKLIMDISSMLTDTERRFLVSMMTEEVLWNSLPFNNLNNFPALKWKLLNIRRMDNGKRDKQHHKLRQLLAL